MNRLGLVPGSAPDHGIVYVEPVIDGEPVRRLLAYADPQVEALDHRGLGPVGDDVPVFAYNWPAGMPEEVLMTLGAVPSSLPHGRVPLFVCPACGDLGCGAVSAVIERNASSVIWRDFGWDVNYVNEADAPDPILGGPFEFDREQYEAEIHRFIETFDVVRASVPPRPDPTSRAKPSRTR